MKYKNITISGLPGTGTTTLLKELMRELPSWEGFSGGEFMRAYALEKKLFQPKKGIHHDARHYEDDFDRKIDFGMREALETKGNQIIESWLSGFMAQNIPGVLKVLLICEDSLRVDRVVNRDEVSVMEAKTNMFEREHANKEKWIRMYSKQWNDWVVGTGKIGKDDPINFWDDRLYDLVIDTFSNSKEQTFEKVLRKIDK